MDEELIGLGSISELFMSEEELKSYKDSHNGKTPSEVEKERQATIEKAEEAATYANPGYESGSDMDSFADALEEQRKNKIKDDLKSQVDSIGDLNKLASLYESLMTEKELEEYKNSHHGKTPSEIEKNQQEKENALSIQEAGYESDDTVSDYIDFAQDKRRKEFKDRIKEQIDNPAHRGGKEKPIEKEEVLEISEQEVQKEPADKTNEEKTIEIKEDVPQQQAEDTQQNPLYLKPYKYEQNHTFLHAADRLWNAFSKESTLEDAFLMLALDAMALPLTMAADLTAHLVDQAKKRQEHYFNQKMEYNNKNLEKFMGGENGKGLSKYGIEPPKSKEEYPAVLLQVLNKKVNEEIQALRDKGVPEESISNRKIRKEAMADMFGEIFNRVPEELTAKEVKDLKRSLKDIKKYFPSDEQKNTADNLKEQNKAYGDAKRSYDADTNRIRRARTGKKIMHQYNRNLNRGNEGNVA